MKDLSVIKTRFKGGKIYSYRQVLDLICKGQSSTAEYILMDMIACGMIVKTVNGYRINQ